MPLRDTTLRSIVFGKNELEVVAGPQKQMILKDTITMDQFEVYISVLSIMGQLARLVYCDSAIIEEVLKSDVFGTKSSLVNDLITATDKKWGPKRKQAGETPRPMLSYIGPVVSKKTGAGIARYVSTPDDVTFLFLSGSHLTKKNGFFQQGDVILSFKGSSTVENFKHDLYSQFTRAEISPGCFVPGSFLKHLKSNLDIIKLGLTDFKPTRLFITGHSMGGAYATLLSYLLLLEGVGYPIHLVTFGSPTIMADAARNQFNQFLDSGKVTLDRVVSSYIGKVADIIPSTPAGFSHPGFQPLRTELYPETKTGRAYHIDALKKVFTGGAFWSGPEKKKYEALTVTHMPNLVSVSSKVAFTHAGYLDMSYLGALRLPGMKNPSFAGNTFVANIYDDGMAISWATSAVQEVSPEATTSATMDNVGTPPKAAAPEGARRTRRFRRGKMSRRR